MTTLQQLISDKASSLNPSPFVAFKIDSKDKQRGWIAYGTPEGNLIQHHGLLESENFISDSKFRPGKNLGKSNETSPEEQSWLEAESKWKNKLAKDYYKSLEKASDTLTVLPMLAESFDKYSDRIDWGRPVHVQPKLDGMRCLAVCEREGLGFKVKLVARTGKDIVVTTRGTMHHVLEDIQRAVDISLGDTSLLSSFDVFAFDGELYADELTFQQSMSAIKKSNDNTPLIKFHMYDMAIPDFPLSFRGRSYNLSRLWRLHSRWNHTQLVPTENIRNEKELHEAHARFIGLGYEGTILRHGDDPYKMKGRSKSLLKYKDFIDEVAEIIDIEPTDGNPFHGTPVCRFEDGRVFRCGTKISHVEREELLANKEKFIGEMAEIRFFEWTDDGLPRFPIYIGVRLDK